MECFKISSWAFSHFNSWAASSFNTSGLMDNKLACDKVVTNISGNKMNRMARRVMSYMGQNIFQ